VVVVICEHESTLHESTLIPVVFLKSLAMYAGVFRFLIKCKIAIKINEIMPGFYIYIAYVQGFLGYDKIFSPTKTLATYKNELSHIFEHQHILHFAIDIGSFYLQTHQLHKLITWKRFYLCLVVSVF